MAVNNIENQIKQSINEAAITFDRIAASALGQRVVQDVLDVATKPLVNDLQRRFDMIAASGFGKNGEPFESVKLRFVSVPSQTKPNVRRTGPTGPGWQVAWLMEFGSIERHKSSGASTGIQPATGYMRTAVIMNAEKVSELVVTGIQKAIEIKTEQLGLKSNK
ncbi:MAG: hypothetical protein WC760_02950 [Bacteroidia bacterium]|jgi:hypothetical protein